MIAGKRGFGCSGWREGCPFVLWREYKGQRAGDDQIRQLLQRRVLLGPLVFGESGGVVLQLLDSGELTEIPIPVGRLRQRAGKAGQRPTSRRTRTQRRENPSSESEEARPRGGRPSDFAPITLGRCPLCGSEVLDQAKSYRCSGWQSGLQVHDLEDHRRQANHDAHGPGAAEAGSQPGAQGLHVEVWQAV